MNIVCDTKEDTDKFIRMVEGWTKIRKIRKILTNKRSHHDQIKAIKDLVK